MANTLLKPTKPIAKAQRRWVDVTLEGARFHNVNLVDAKLRGVLMMNAEIDGWVHGMTVNGVEIAPLIEAELDRRHPERVLMRSGDPDALREAWTIIERGWKRTMTKARKLPEHRLHERGDGEWSLVETLRHLIFVTDAWLGRTVLGLQQHYAPIGLLNTDNAPWFPEACGLDPTANPSLTEVLEVRGARMKQVRDTLAAMTSEELARRCRTNRSPGYPSDPRKHTVGQCIRVVLNEEWEHHRFVVRDLKQLT